MSDCYRHLLLGAIALLVTQAAIPQGNGKTATLGNARAGATLLSYDQLSACLQQRDELGQRKLRLEAERATLDRERTELLRSDEALKAERAKVDQMNATAADIHKRNQALSQQISEFNRRVASFDAASPSGPAGDRQRRSLERDKAALEKSAAELDAERAALGPDAEQLIKGHQARAMQRDAAAADWNTRSAALTKAVDGYQSELSEWQADCEGRTYREDDEKLIKSGK